LNIKELGLLQLIILKVGIFDIWLPSSTGIKYIITVYYALFRYLVTEVDSNKNNCM